MRRQQARFAVPLVLPLISDLRWNWPRLPTPVCSLKPAQAGSASHRAEMQWKPQDELWEPSLPSAVAHVALRGAMGSVLLWDDSHRLPLLEKGLQ